MGRVDISRVDRQTGGGGKKKEKKEGSKERTARSGEESCGVLTGSCNNEFIPRARTLSGSTTYHFSFSLRLPS